MRPKKSAVKHLFISIVLFAFVTMKTKNRNLIRSFSQLLAANLFLSRVVVSIMSQIPHQVWKILHQNYVTTKML